jgi:predicted metal-dependent phosphoesterase TrpH
MVRRLSETGVQVSPEAVERHVAASAAPGRPHLARALVDEGHTENHRAAFEQYLGNGQPGYIPVPTMPAIEAIEALHEAGGVAVLAHPGQWMPGKVIKRLRNQGLDGIECIFPSHPDYLVDYYRNICYSHDLVITGGSDYHGSRDAEKLSTVGLSRKEWKSLAASVNF